MHVHHFTYIIANLCTWCRITEEMRFSEKTENSYLSSGFFTQAHRYIIFNASIHFLKSLHFFNVQILSPNLDDLVSSNKIVN